MKKVLLVEDNQDLQFLLSFQIKSMGFAIISANNGMEGVEKAIEGKPDLIIMDILMPGMNGREATRKIRSNPMTKYIPIIVLTALFRHIDLESCIEAGCNDYIVKPFSFKVLQEKIWALIPISRPNTK